MKSIQINRVIEITIPGFPRNSIFFLIFLLTAAHAIAMGGKINHLPGDANKLVLQGNTLVADDSIPRQLDEVVVKAFNRRQEIVQIPGALTSLGSLVIERENPSVNILPVLQYAPGLFAQQGATNTSRVVIRGTGARVLYATGKIRAYFNNIPLTNTSGITFLEDIDPAIIQSLEIIKGPAPSIYGAGLGGTIVLNARSPRDRVSGIYNSTQVGYYGLLQNSTILDHVKEKYAMSVVYSHAQSDGYRENNEFRRDAITFTSQHNLAPHSTLSVLFGWSDLKSHIPSSIDSLTFINNPRSAAANWQRTRGYEDGSRFMGGVSAEHRINDFVLSELAIFGIWHDEKEVRPFDVFLQKRGTLGASFRAIYNPLPASNIVSVSAGGEVFNETYDYSNFRNADGLGRQGDLFGANKEDVLVSNYFAQVDANPGRFTLSGGININLSQRRYRNIFNNNGPDLSGNYTYGTIVSPRIAAGYQWLRQQSVFISFSHGFAPPSLEETLTPEGTINPEIKPEKSWNLEAGLRGKLLDGALFYDISLYRMVISDLLVAQRVGEDAWVGRNAGQSLHRGIEAELHWVMWRQVTGSWLRFEEVFLRTNLTINDFRFTDFIDRGIDQAGNRIPGVPRQVWFAGLYVSSGSGMYVLPNMRLVGSMAMNDSNTRFTQPYSIASLTAGYKTLILKRMGIDVFIKAENLFDTKYASMVLINAPSFRGASPRYYYPGLPFHLTGGIKIAVK